MNELNIDFAELDREVEADKADFLNAIEREFVDAGMKKTDLMGKRVCVSKKFVRHYHGLERKWEVFETPSFYGWVVGFRTIKSGYVNYAHNEYDQTVFTATEYIPCVLICTNPYKNPVRVPVSEIERYLE